MADISAQRADDGRRRAVISTVLPQIECGRFPVKRTVGEEVVVTADILADGHDVVRAELLYRAEDDPEWIRKPMEALGNDRWVGRFSVDRLGRFRYGVEAWVDPFRSWRDGFVKKVRAREHTEVDILVGAELTRAAAGRTDGDDDVSLVRWADRLEEGPIDERTRAALDPLLLGLVDRFPDRSLASRSRPDLEVVVDRERARFSSWYELFPRSTGAPGTHGTLADVERLLPEIAAMGFDVLYLPPIHPIGQVHRKGKNNTPTAEPGDVGSPWAIGAAEGGHTAVHPDLGDADDLRRLADAARAHGVDLALDIAYQCAPDHPWVTEHPEWFKWRPDGTVQYAENPPKKYQDIYPFDFECDEWHALWEALAGVVEHWVGHGVRVFRVDNPHTKPFPFWEWLITRVKAEHPDVIFLSEAFTRPRVMERLAKLGFTQSYTYFTWRNTAWEIREYMRDLTRTELQEYFRPNFWPNTPDILPELLQTGGRPAFMARLVLAGTLAASYGVYGPAYELCENRPLRPGGEEYLDSEKYQLRDWERDRPDSLRELMRRVNQIRRDNPALQSNRNLLFHATDNDSLLCYSKRTDDGDNAVLVVVNLDPHHVQSGWVDLALDELGLDPERPFQVHDLIGDGRYLWQGRRNFVRLEPVEMPAQVFRIRRRLRTEHDFEYFL